MIIPKYKVLTGRLACEESQISWALGPSWPRFNPRHYKFYWQVFTLTSPYEGYEFFQHAPRLCSAQYQKEMERLCAERVPALIYSFKLPRRDPANPFDLSHPKWKDVEFAPSWDEDQDPIVEGGHK
jgi:hypothetical protein